ncbi:MAG: ABC transporter substrate-binding protein [Xanthobacteraceae bacterium]
MVESIAHPGKNVTGFSLFYPELTIKHLEILREIVPGVARAAILWNPANRDHPDTIRSAQNAAALLNIQIVPVSAAGPDEFDRAFAEIAKSHVDGLIVLGDAMLRVNRQIIVADASKIRVPAIYGPRDYADAGGLISYGACIPCNFRNSATYVDKILKGAKAADLPVQQPSTFEFVVNLGTAQKLGVKIPQSILLRADQVLE